MKALIKCWLLMTWLCGCITVVFAQPNITGVEYYINTDPGYGNGINVPITPASNLPGLSFNLDISSYPIGLTMVGVRSRDVNGAWSHDNRWLIAKLPQQSSTPNITRSEYYINTDPGYGNGIPVVISPAGSDGSGSFTIDITNQPIGLTMVGVRSRDANGAWSHDNRWLIAKLPQQSSTPNITRSEYYLNTDPGYGNGIPVAISPAGSDGSGSFTIDITNQPIGLTMVGIRSRDANGAWSHDNRWLIAKLPAENVNRPVKKVEYYIDTDPGYGNGNPVAIEQSTNLPNRQLNVNVTGLSAGKHYIFYRSQDLLGAWSHDNVDSFNLATPQASPVIVVSSVNKNTFCAGDSIKIGYQATGTYTGANTFKAFLSDAVGSFTNEVEIGTLSSLTGGLVAGKLPGHIPDGSGYKLRIKSSSPVVTGEASGNVITIHDRPFAQTITGITSANGTETWPYSIPNVATSSFNWLITNGVQTNGANTNSSNVQWNAGTANAIKAGKINIIESNQFGCPGDTSIALVNIYKLRIGISTPAAACKAFSMAVTASADGAFGAGNILTAQLSNAAGSFASPVVIGSLPLVGNGLNQPAVINTTIPAATPNGTNYRVRIISTTGSFIGDTSAAISIQKPAIGADIARSKCPGFGYNLQTDYTDVTLTYTYLNNSFVVLPNATNVDVGTYNVIGTNSNGCADTAVVTVTNNVKPNIGADTTIYHNCPGETTNLLPLYITTGLTAVWNTGTPTAAPPGIYRLIVTNASGCSDTAFANIILEVATWTGSTSNNWHTAANWNINKVPGQQTHVIIPSGTSNPCNITSSDAEAASVQVKAAAAITTSNGRQLMIRQNCASLPPN